MADSSNDNTTIVNSLKEKIEKLEGKLLSYQIDNTNKASEIKKHRNELSKYHSTTHNTSSQFPLTSTFIQQWDNFALGTIMDTFEKVYDDSELISYLVKTVFIEVRNACRNIINNKIKELISYLGLKETISIELINFVYFKYKVIIFQDYFTTLFALNDCVINSIKSNTKKQIDAYNTSIPNRMNSIRERYDDILDDLYSNEMKKFIKEAFDLNMFMLLHEPELLVDFNDELSYIFYDKNEHINIEGFPGDNSPCILILPSPLLKKGLRFQGIKSAVYICLNPSSNILHECTSKESNTNINKHIYKSVNSLGSYDFSIGNYKEPSINHCIDESINLSMPKELLLMNERNRKNKNNKQKEYSNKLSSFERSIPTSKKKCSLYKTKSASIKKRRRSFNSDTNNNCMMIKPSFSSTLSLMKPLDESKNNSNPNSLNKKKNIKKYSFNKDEFLRSLSSKIIDKNIVFKKCISSANSKLKYESKLITNKKKREKNNSNINNDKYNLNSSPEDTKVNCQFKTQLPFGNNNINTNNNTNKKALYEENNSRNDDHQMINHFRYNNCNLLLTNSSCKKKKIILNRDQSNKSVVKRLENNENSFQKLLINLNHHNGNGNGIPKNKNGLVSHSSRKIDCNNSRSQMNEKNNKAKHMSASICSLDLNYNPTKYSKNEEKTLFVNNNDKSCSSNNIVIYTQVKMSNENNNDIDKEINESNRDYFHYFYNNKSEIQLNGLRKR